MLRVARGVLHVGLYELPDEAALTGDMEWAVHLDEEVVLRMSLLFEHPYEPTEEEWGRQ